MSVSSIELLRFILGLLGNPSKAEEFTADPSGALAVAGLSNVSCADVDAIAPLIANAVPGAVAIAGGVGGGGGGGATPEKMIQEIVQNVAVSNFDNSGVIQNIWSDGDVRQAFASDGGFALGGSLFTSDPVVIGDGNLVASDDAHAAGRDIIQNQADGNLALGGDQTIAQDEGVIAGGDSMAGGDKVGGNNNEAENTGNDNSVTIGNIGVDLSQDNSVSVGGNQNNAENTGNATYHDDSVTIGDIAVDMSDRSDHSTTIGDIAVDMSDRSDHSTTIGDIDVDLNSHNSTVDDHSVSVGGNQNNAENTGNATYHDESVTIGDIGVDLSQDNSVGGDVWETGSNVGGIGNTDNRNSNNTTDSGNTVAITETHDDSINIGTIAVDLNSHNSTVDDNSTTFGDFTYDDSTTIGDVSVGFDQSTTVGGNQNNAENTGNATNHDESVNVDVDVAYDDSVTVGDFTYDTSFSGGDVIVDNSTESNTFTYDDHSIGGDFYQEGGGSSYGGDYYEQGSGNTAVDVDYNSNSFDWSYTDVDIDGA